MIYNAKILVVTLIITVLSRYLLLAALKDESCKRAVDRASLAICFVMIVSFLSPSGWMALIAGLALVPVLAKKPGDVAAIYIAADLCSPGIIKLLSFGPINSLGSISLSNAIGFGALCYLFIAGRKINRSKLDIAFWAIILVLTMSSLREGSFAGTSRYVFALSLSFLLPFSIIRRSVGSSDEARSALASFVLASVTLSIFFIFESFRNWPLFPTVIQNLSDVEPANIVKMRGGMLRASGPILEAMSAGMAVMVGAIITFAIRSEFKTKVLWLATLAVIVVGVFMPQSRNAILGLIIGFMGVEFARKRWGLLVGVSLAGSAFITLSMLGLIGVGMFSAETSGSNDYRSQLLSRGLEELRDSPVVGFSSQEMLFRLADMRQGEGIIDLVNVWLWFALSTGLAGLALFCVAISSTTVSAISMSFKAKKIGAINNLMPACAGCLVAISSMFAFTSFNGMPVFMTVSMIGLVASGSVIRAVRPRDNREENPTLGDRVVSDRRGKQDIEEGQIRLPGLANRSSIQPLRSEAYRVVRLPVLRR